MTQFLINMTTNINANTYVNTSIVKHIKMVEHVYHMKDPNPQKLNRIHIPKKNTNMNTNTSVVKHIMVGQGYHKKDPDPH